WIFQYAPGGSAFRAPGRWSQVFVVPLALLAAVGAAAIGGALRGRAARVVPGALLAGAMGEHLDLPIRVDRLPDPPPVYRWLASQPGDFAALELPTYYGSADASYQFWQTVHWKRIVNGAVGFYPAGIVELVEAWDPLDPDALATRIR